jgi:hypothetical protein
MPKRDCESYLTEFFANPSPFSGWDLTGGLALQ